MGTRIYSYSQVRGNTIKVPCFVATTVDVSLTGFTTIDGVTLTGETRVLVKDQINKAQNGIYLAESGPWIRDIDMSSNDDVFEGILVRVNSGNTNADKMYVLTTADPITLGITDLTFGVLATGGGGGAVITGGTYFSGTTTLELYDSTGGTITITGFTTGTGGTLLVSGNTGLGIQGNYLYTTYNTLLDPTLAMASTIGGLSGGTTVAQISGKTFVALFDDLLFPTQAPTYTIPTITMGGVANSTVEVGSTIAPSITLSAVKNDAGNFSLLRILRNGSSLSGYTGASITQSVQGNIAAQFGYTDPNNPNSGFTINPSPYIDSYVIPAPSGASQTTTSTYNGNGNYYSGLPKNNNKGVIDGRTPAVLSVNAPQAGNTGFTTTTYTYTGIYPYFWGVSAGLPTTASIAAAISGGTANKVLSSASGTITITFGAVSQYLWFAHFTNYTSKTTWYVDALNSGSIGGGSNLFASPVTQAVSSPTSLWGSINFKIYIGNYQTTTTGSMELRN